MRIPKTCFSTRLSGSARVMERRVRNMFQGQRKRPPIPVLILGALAILFCGSVVSCQVEVQQDAAVPFALPPDMLVSLSPAPSSKSDDPPQAGSLELLYSLTAPDHRDLDAVRAIAQAWLDFEGKSEFIQDTRIDFLELAWESEEFAAYRFEFYFLASDPQNIPLEYYALPYLGDEGWYRPEAESPYLVLRDGMYYSVICSNTFLLPAARIPLALDADLPPRPTMFVSDSPKEALRAVLLGQAQFISVAQGTRYQPLSIYDASRMFFNDETALTIRLWEARSHPYDFAMADMDRDGIPEVILVIPDGGYTILHYEEGTVYGYEAYYRWFMPLKMDGTIHVSGGAASYGYGFFTFMGDTVLTYEETCCNPRYADWSDMVYVVDREETSWEEFEAAYAQLDAKADALWYSLTAENIDLALSRFP